MIRIFHLLVLAVICSSLDGAAVWAQESSTILLVDDHHVLYRSGTKRTLNQLKRYSSEPMIACDKPYETTVAYCSVHRDDKTGKYQLWYQAWSGSGVFLCYAESKDGLKWIKPNLNIHEFNGKKNNNIVMRLGYGGSVIYDPRDPDPKRRYKAAFWEQSKKPYGTSLAFSPDGIHWAKFEKNPIIAGSHGDYIQPPFSDDPIISSKTIGPPLSTSDVTDLVWDHERQVYAIYAKTWLDGPTGIMHWKRAVVRTESKDFETWTKPQLVMAADELDGKGGEHELAITSGGGGSGGIQFHSGPAFCYNDMYFSMLQVMDSGNTGNMPIELTLSHNGYDWQRPFRHNFFLPPLDDKTKYDASIIWSNATPIYLEDEFRFYYGAYGNPWNSSDNKQPSGIGMASIRRDRFAGLKPIEKFGQITFKAMELKDCQAITVNANASGGTIRVEILNADGYRIRGFSKDKSIVIKGDSLRHKVTWKDADISNLPRGSYKIRLHLDSAEVFAITLRKEQ